MIKTEEGRRQYWQETLSHFLKSGLSQIHYARQYGVSGKSLRNWSKRLGIPLTRGKQDSRGEGADSFSFIELSSSSCSAPLLVKLEMLNGKGHKIKVEMTVLWEQAVRLLTALGS